jgi:hypothetical protein
VSAIASEDGFAVAPRSVSLVLARRGVLAYYAVFAFPDGRLTGRLEQALLAGMAL